MGELMRKTRKVDVCVVGGGLSYSIFTFAKL